MGARLRRVGLSILNHVLFWRNIMMAVLKRIKFSGMETNGYAAKFTPETAFTCGKRGGFWRTNIIIVILLIRKDARANSS